MINRAGRVVEVQGTWLENLGARQLLHAAVRGLRGGSPDVEVAIDPRWGSFGERSELGLLQIAPREMPGRAAIERALDAGARAAPRAVGRLFDDYGLVRRRDAHALVDASGFALSDQWGARKAAQRWDVIERYVRRDRPVVLLPQAVGPFADTETAAYARKILTRADRVWVRDRCSLRHANDLVGTRASIGIAPDITLLDPGVPPSGPEADVVVVPNGRMVEQGGWGRAEYLGALAGAARAAETRGFSVAVMLHTREPADHHLGCELSEIVGCRSMHERDPRAAKGRLGAAQLVIGSRFHALLGALSQGVPAVAIGWSHKYDELFADFGIADLARAPRSAGATASLVDHALAVLPELRAKVESRLPELQAAVAAMWIECRTVLGVGGTAAVAATTAT